MTLQLEAPDESIVSDEWFEEYTFRMMIQHLLLLEDHFLDYGREPSDQCQSCMYWHIVKIRAYASLECVKFSKGTHLEVCIDISPFMDTLEAEMSSGLSKEKSLELANEVREWRYKIAEFSEETDASEIPAAADHHSWATCGPQCALHAEHVAEECIGQAMEKTQETGLEHGCILTEPPVALTGHKSSIHLGHRGDPAFHTHPSGTDHPSEDDFAEAHQNNRPYFCIGYHKHGDSFVSCWRNKEKASDPGLGTAIMTGLGVGTGLVVAQKVLDKDKGNGGSNPHDFLALSKCEKAHHLGPKLGRCSVKLEEENIAKGCPPMGLGTSKCPNPVAICRASISMPVCSKR